MNPQYDHIIVGNGLAGRLTALGLLYISPLKKVLLIDQNPEPLPTHTWSCFKNDWPKALTPFLETLPWHHWDKHRILFSDLDRTLDQAYCSLKEKDLLSHSHHLETWWGCQVTPVKNEPHQIQVYKSANPLDIKTLNCPQIIYATGWGPGPFTPCGYQKFVGLEVHTHKPHGIHHPVIMDTRIPQTDGYRFFYLLPFSPTEILVEDTYYSHDPTLDVTRIKQEILKYCQQKNLGAFDVQYQEQGVLPLPFLPQKPPAPPGALAIGPSSGHFNPVTGYSLPFILRQLDRYLYQHKPPQSEPRPHWMWYLLNQFMFLGAPPENRWRVFRFFYNHPPSLIAKFYSGTMGFADWMRFFSSLTPPIPVFKALSIAGRFAKQMTNRPKL